MTKHMLEHTQASEKSNDFWMPIYIGDFLADTMHLNAETSGAYLLLMFHCWKRGCLPDDIPALARIAKLWEAGAESKVRGILVEYFQQDKDGAWHQKRVDKERSRSKKASEKATKAANARWNKDATSNAPSICLDDAKTMPLHSHIHIHSNIDIDNQSNQESEHVSLGIEGDDDDDEL